MSALDLCVCTCELYSWPHMSIVSGTSVSDTGLSKSCLGGTGKTLEIGMCTAGYCLLGGRLGSKS